MTRMRRWLVNLFGGWFQLRRRFPAALLDELAAAIAAGERSHLGEIRFAIESRLAPLAVLEGLDARTRARQVFFFNDTATTEIYTLSLHDALPIWHGPHGTRF